MTATSSASTPIGSVADREEVEPIVDPDGGAADTDATDAVDARDGSLAIIADAGDVTQHTGYLWNLSPRTVILHGEGGDLTIPPLGEERLDEDSPTFDRAVLRNNAYLEMDTGVQSEAGEITAGITIWVGFIGAIVVGVVSEGQWWLVAGWIALTVLGGVATYRHVREDRNRVRSLSRLGTLGFVLLIGFGIPTAIVFVGSGLYDLVRVRTNSLLDPAYNQLVVYRLAQVLFLGLATTFPVLLYFLFDRQSRDTLRGQFLSAVFRLDGTIRSASDWKARYISQVEGVYGSVRGRNPRRGLLKTRNSPVVVATLVLAIGWSLIFLNRFGMAIDSEGLLSGSPMLLLEPEQTTVAFGFLGAYLFAVQSVLRSYMRADLRPKAYSQITARILIVVVLAAPLSLLFSSVPTAARGLAFFAGLVPDTVLQLLWEALQKLIGVRPSHNDELAGRQPLTDLNGIDLYDRARLAEEGVTNVESLAHGDLVDLLLQTRIPPGRLVDWVDQAVLRVQIDDDAYLKSLRGVGVRTATDLLTVPVDHDEALLVATGADNPAGRARLKILVDSLQDSEWAAELLHWRSNPTREPVEIDARLVRPIMAGSEALDGAPRA